jgi:putative transposase
MVSEQIQSPVRYPIDLIDEEWEIIEAIISELDPYTTGRPRTTDLREIMNAIFLYK